MSSDAQLWYRIGYLLESARERPSEAGHALAELADRLKQVGRRKAKDRASSPLPPADHILAAGIAAVAGRLLASWKPRHDTSVGDLLRAALTGAGAAIFVELARPLLRGEAAVPEIDEETWDRVLAGVAQGLVYGAVVAPRIPGPTPLRGALYGAAEYAAVPMGGLGRIFGRATPQGRLPVVGRALEGLHGRDRTFLEHLAFGVVMGVLYGAEEEDSSGIRVEVEDA